MPEPNADLMAFVEALISKPKGSKRKPFINRESLDKKAHAKAIAEAARKARPLDSPRWKDEAIVLLRRHTTCTCGASFVAPSDNVFMRRFHPTYGVHFQAIPFHDWTPLHLFLPHHIETHEVRVAVCCECFPQRITSVLNQLPLFKDPECQTTSTQSDALSPSSSSVESSPSSTIVIESRTGSPITLHSDDFVASSNVSASA